MVGKVLIVILTFVMQFYCISLFAESHPINKINEIVQVNLNMFYEVGQVSGYIVFYNKQGQQCAVKPPSSANRKFMIPYLIVGDEEMRLYITPSSFETLPLRGGGVVYAYRINPFIVTKLRKGGKIIFRFELCNLRTVDTAYTN